MKVDLYNIITGEVIPAEEILAVLKEVFNYLYNFILGEI